MKPDESGRDDNDQTAGHRRLEFVYSVALADFKRTYSGTALGIAWTVLQPLLLFVVLYTVFTRVIRFGGDIPNYAVLLLLNVALYLFFQQATNGALRSLVAKRGIVQSIDIPTVLIPMAAMLATALAFLGSLVVAFTWILVSGVEVSATWILFPACLAYLMLITVATGIMLSSLYPSLRDVGQVWRPVVRLLFYATPVIFPFELIPDGWLRVVAAANPLTPLFVQVRAWVVDPQAPDWFDVADSTFTAAFPFLSLAVLVVAAFVAHSWARKAIAETV